MKFGPKSKDEASIFAFEELRADLQYEIMRRMKESDHSSATRQNGRSAAWVSQILGDDANLTLETIANVFLALGSHCHVASVLIGSHYYDVLWDDGASSAFDWHESFALEIDRLAEAVDTEPLLGLVASGKRSTSSCPSIRPAETAMSEPFSCRKQHD